MSPMLFDACSQNIIKRALEDENSGIVFKRTLVNTILYEDDRVIVEDCIVNLQRLMDRVVTCSEDYGLMLNIKKKKFMTIPKRPKNNETLTVHENTMENCEKYFYLGKILTLK